MSLPDTTKQDTNELRKDICKVFGIFPEELEHNLPGGISLKKCQELETLFASYSHQREQEAYKKGYIDGGIGVLND